MVHLAGFLCKLFEEKLGSSVDLVVHDLISGVMLQVSYKT